MDTDKQFSDETIPIHGQIRHTMYRKGGRLFIHHDAKLPDQVCIKCGKRIHKVVNKGLRNPRNPLTWFGGQPRLEVGLCKKHYEDLMVAKTLTFSILGIGIVILGVGIVTQSIGSVVFGLLAILGCGVFRARVPIWSPNAKDDSIQIVGAGEKFQALFPNHDVEE